MSKSNGSNSSNSNGNAMDEKECDSIILSEPKEEECPRCKHYKILEEAIDSIESQSFFIQPLKCFLYGILWMGIVILFFSLFFRKHMCEILNSFENE